MNCKLKATKKRIVLKKFWGHTCAKISPEA